MNVAQLLEAAARHYADRTAVLAGRFGRLGLEPGDRIGLHSIAFLGALPKNPTGKILKKELRRLPR